ncbi:MAG: S8 family serine peptidase, partial [Xanthomonadales bacterium]|nr:S8 family serine peptidase [Xanthomonadales bacterium]
MLSLLLVPPCHAQPDVNHRVEVHVAGRAFDPTRDDLSRLTPATQTAAGLGLRIVQLRGPVQQRHLDALAAAGVRVLQYYPHDSYLVWADATALQRAAAMPDARWVGDFSPEWKQSPELFGRRGLINQVLVHYVNDGQPDVVLDALAALGGQLVQDYRAQRDGRFREALFRVPAERLASIAELPQVLWFGYQSPTALRDDEMSDQIVVGNVGQSIPQPGYLAYLKLIGLDGSGVRWSVTDDGVDLEHPDLVTRISGGFSYPGCNNGAPGSDGPSGGHGSHVAGILAGTGAGAFTDGLGFTYGLGVAPGAELFVQNPVCGPGASWPPTGGWSVISANALNGGAMGTNASWTTSEGARHGYQASERLFDQLVRDGNLDSSVSESFTFIFSAGNSGPGPATLTSPKEAKNVISVGATLNFRAGQIDQVDGYSSRGPGVDGRLLPTLVAPGTGIASTRRRAGGLYCNAPIPETDGLYAYCLGTSMAAPHVSGLAVLLTQWWRDRHQGSNPSPAMLKALLISGTNPLSGGDLRPDNSKGWGLAGLAAPVLDPTISWAAVDQTRVLDDVGDTHRFAVQVLDPALPLQVTLVWTDAPGAISANPALVNDLDLEVESADMQYLGNVLGASGSELGGTADRLNNIERVLIPGSQSETAIIRVRAHALPGDGVPGSGDETDQDYALFCSNCSWITDFDIAALSGPAAICAPAEALFEVELAAIDGYAESVELSVGNTPAGVTPSVSPSLIATLPATAQITLDTSGGATSGSIAVPLLATSIGQVRERILQFELATQPAAPVELMVPVDGNTVAT